MLICFASRKLWEAVEKLNGNSVSSGSGGDHPHPIKITAVKDSCPSTLE